MARANFMDYFLPALLQGIGGGGMQYAQLLQQKEQDRQQAQREQSDYEQQMRILEREYGLRGQEQLAEKQLVDQKRQVAEILRGTQKERRNYVADFQQEGRDQAGQIAAQLGLREPKQPIKPPTWPQYMNQRNLATNYYAQSTDITLNAEQQAQFRAMANATWDNARQMAEAMGIEHQDPPWKIPPTQPGVGQYGPPPPPGLQQPTQTILGGVEARPDYWPQGAVSPASIPITPTSDQGLLGRAWEALSSAANKPRGDQPAWSRKSETMPIQAPTAPLGLGTPAPTTGMGALVGPAGGQRQDPYIDGDTPDSYMAKLSQAGFSPIDAQRFLLMHFPNIRLE